MLLYSVTSLDWSKELNSFYGCAWEMKVLNEEKVRFFPSNKADFVVVNPTTKGSKVFTFKKETEDHYLFTSEDGIKCVVCINPLYHEKEVPQYHG